MRELETNVLVVGAGGAGLALSIFLGDMGVEALTIERHSGTSHLPKAHYINQRSMEIFRQHGLADAIYARSAPRKNLGKIRWMTSIGGDGPLDAIQFAQPSILGGGENTAMYDLKGTTHPTNVPQIRLEPILREQCEMRHPGRLLFRHELESFEQDDVGVTAIVLERDTGERIKIRCQFMVAADGGKTINPALGIEMIGEKDLGDFYTVWFAADLSDYIKDDDAVMRRIFHPEKPYRVNSLLTFGPDHWDGRSEEWASNFTLGPRFSSVDESEPVTDEQLIEDVRSFLKVDVPLKVLRVSRWKLETVIADRMKVGRILIIGDAAHKHPPAAGLGLNSGFQDAHNVAWKLALATRGRADPALLDTYEAERRPVTASNVRWAINASTNAYLIMAGIGVIAGETPEQTTARFKVLVSDSFEGESRRAQLNEILRIQRVEYAAHDRELGFTYPEGALVDDGFPPAWRDPMGHIYEPTTRPGSRLPHAWVSHGGKRLSTHDLIPMGGFALLTGAQGLDWCAAAAELAAHYGVPIHAYRIGDRCEVEDPSGLWRQEREIADGGAVLVRPDAHVAYRAMDAVPDARASLRAALDAVLGARSVAGDETDNPKIAEAVEAE
jgi:2,4-dichlorophenol 6-monooxygenase